jgi:hypothetical protein
MSEDINIPGEHFEGRQAQGQIPGVNAEKPQEKNPDINEPATGHKKTETIPQPETMNMETHAEHLHKTPGHGWKHYLFEFLMLFLAVTLGFFVENWRDRFVENKRERDFITTLAEDLKSDTSQLTGDISAGKNRETMIDSLILLLTLPDRSKYGAQMYYFARNISRPVLFFPNDRTILQLKNSGSLRMIRKLAVSNEIMYYDQQLRNLQYAFEDENRMRDGLREKAGKIFDGSIFNNMFDTLRDKRGISVYKKPQGNPALITQNRESINEYISAAQYLKGPVRAIRLRQESLEGVATNLISLLKKEYRMK